MSNKNVLRLLSSLGFRSCYAGYWYLAEVLQLLVYDHVLTQKLSSAYQVVASDYNVSIQAVRNGIRKEILRYWTSYQDATWNLIVHKPIVTPTNEDIILALCDHLNNEKHEKRESH